MRTSSYPSDESKRKFCEDIAKHYGSDIITSKQINEFIKMHNLSYPYFLTYDKSRSAGWGKYKVLGESPSTVKNAVSVAILKQIEKTQPPAVSLADNDDAFIPIKDKTYVPFGFYNDLKNIINSKIFYPIYITGLSGNGKTLMVLQVCAELKRELVRVNITQDTNELDLFGCYELVNGSSIRREGPVITAMKRGAILLLDETDYGSEKLLCLQPVLEGKPFLDKKTNTIIHPQPGFNVIACANTKGKGSTDGRFIGANILNDAFLERFAITVEQEYPNISTESKILNKNFEALNLDEKEFTTCLVSWADQVRKAFNDGAVDEVISTRRLVHIVKAYAIFGVKLKAIKLCLNRFDDDTKHSFIDLYTKIDAEMNKSTESVSTEQPTTEIKEENVSPGSSDTEFVVLASRMQKLSGKKVIIKREIEQPSGQCIICVYCDNNRIFEYERNIPSINDSPEAFEESIKKMTFAVVSGITF